MKKGKTKKWMILLSILTILIIPLNKIKALTTANFTNNGSTLQVSINNTAVYKSTQLYPTGTQNVIFNDYGEGNILFTFQTSSYTTATTSQLSEVNLITNDNEAFTCDIGTTQGYLDSNKQIIIFTANCPVNLTNRALKTITFTRGGGSGQLDIAIGSLITFISKDNNTSTSTIIADLNTIQQYQIDINNNISQFKNATHTDLQAIINALNQNHQDTNDIKQSLATEWAKRANDWNEFKNSDISNNTKTQPNQDEYDNVQNKENTVYDNLDDIDIDTLIDMNVDINTNNWIWNTITTLLNTNARVFSMVIAVLSLGLSKFILGR